MIAKALEDYTAQDETQLSLKKGALVSVTYMDEASGWWEGTVSIKGQGKQSGWFPADYVKLMSKAGPKKEAENIRPASTTTGATAQVV